MLGDDGAIRLSEVLIYTTTIVHIDLSANMISKDVSGVIREEMQYLMLSLQM
jgi:hypothetical protein